jgi:hypothetical protein
VLKNRLAHHSLRVTEVYLHRRWMRS